MVRYPRYNENDSNDEVSLIKKRLTRGVSDMYPPGAIINMRSINQPLIRLIRGRWQFLLRGFFRFKLNEQTP